jgi:hypothetical protein
MNRLLASEMAKRVRVQRVIRQYDNINHFMHYIEEAFIQSNARPINVIISEIEWTKRLRVNGLDEVGREATLGECQHLMSILGYPSNCFRCRDEDNALSGEHLLQVSLPHPLS